MSEDEKRRRLMTLRLLRGAIVLAVVAISGMICIGLWAIYENASREAERWSSQQLALVVAQTERVLDTAELAFDSITNLLDNLDDAELLRKRPELRSRLKSIVNATPQISDVWVFDASGNVLLSNLELKAGERLNRSDREYFRKIIESPASTFIGGAAIGRFNGALFFPISRGHLRAGGSLAHVIEISMQPSRLQDAFDVMAQNQPGAYFSLLNQDGSLLARYPILSAADLVSANERDLRARRQNLHSGPLTFQTPVDWRERQAVVQVLPRAALVAIVGIETGALSRMWMGRGAAFLGAALPVSALVVFLLAFAYSRMHDTIQELERRLAAEAAMRHSQRMEVLGQLTGGIAHDLNNLLMVMEGGIRKLRRSDAEPRALALIQGATEKAAKLTNALLSYSRQQPQHVVVVDLEQYLTRFEPVLKQAVRGELDLAMRCNAHCHVRVDPTELELALLNLALNARDAMSSGGSLTISVSVRSDPKPDLTGKFVQIDVQDTGCGIPAEHLNRVFEPYFTTKGIGRGTGLGLSQVYGFARQSGGTASIRSEIGRGTVVSIYLPLAAPDIAPETKDREPAPEQMKGTVLLVEDDPQVVEVVQSYLNELGLSVQTAPDGVRARESALAREGRLDLVVSDIQMPGGYSGHDLARDLRRHRPDLPVILVTGFSGSSQDAVQEGFPLLRKPFTLEELARVVREVMENGRPKDRQR